MTMPILLVSGRMCRCDCMKGVKTVRKKGEEFRTIWQKPDDPEIVQIIDQRKLPHEYVLADLGSWQDGARAISDMLVRGAPLIGATAAWSLYLAALESRNSDDQRDHLVSVANELSATWDPLGGKRGRDKNAPHVACVV